MFRVEKWLDRGTFGEVYLVQIDEDRRSTQFVLKKVSRGGEKARYADCEEVTMVLRHPNIVHCYESYQTTHFVYYLMEFCRGGSLRSYLDGLRVSVDETVVLKWLAQMAEALRHLESFRPMIVHRDIKPDNIFLDTWSNIKLGDLGVCKELDKTDQKLATWVGSRAYMSPERLLGKPYDRKADIWATGCVIYETMTLTMAFKKNSNPDQMSGGKHLRFPEQYKAKLNDLVRNMLNRNPEDRPDPVAILMEVKTMTTQDHSTPDVLSMPQPPKLDWKVVVKEVAAFENRTLASCSDEHL